jgi:hypothetical protein
MKSTRRKFLSTTSMLALGVSASASSVTKKKNILVHHVFFWLKNPSSTDDLKKLIAGVKTLEKIETIRMLHVGVPADTEKRPVVDSSYSVSELIFFDDPKGQSTYQDHPVHKKFVEDCSALWEKVIVYDSLNA